MFHVRFLCFSPNNTHGSTHTSPTLQLTLDLLLLYSIVPTEAETESSDCPDNWHWEQKHMPLLNQKYHNPSGRGRWGVSRPPRLLFTASTDRERPPGKTLWGVGMRPGMTPLGRMVISNQEDWLNSGLLLPSGCTHGDMALTSASFIPPAMVCGT